MKPTLTIILLLLLLSAGGCAVHGSSLNGLFSDPVKKSDDLARSGDTRRAIDALTTAQPSDPDNLAAKVALARHTYGYVNEQMESGEEALFSGKEPVAVEHFRNVLAVDSGNEKATQAIRQIKRRERLKGDLTEAVLIRDAQPEQALEKVNQIIAEQPDFSHAVRVRDAILDQTAARHVKRSTLSSEFRKRVSLNFRSQPLQNIFDAISRTAGVNFVFDRDVQVSAPASIFAAETTAEDAINLLLRTQQLDKKVLDANTLLIYPARADKDRSYKELAVRTFYLSHGEAKSVMAALRQMVKPKDIFVDERVNAVIVRDTPATISVAERIVQTLDIPQSEVTMDVQVLEVNMDDQVNLGIAYPEKIDASLITGTTGLTTIGELLQLNRDNVGISGDSGKIGLALNMLQKQGRTKVLANPKIRVRNNEKASINIGERVPVVTTTNANGVVTESIAYQNVGLMLDVQPRISLDNEVSVKVMLEVSNILRRDVTKTGLTAYSLGTRKAETLMTAKNNRTQVLAGLIKQSEISSGAGLPYLSTIPYVGRLFGSDDTKKEKSEIVLLITPHIERNLDLPTSAVTTFLSGTEAEVTTDVLSLREHIDAPARARVPEATEGPSLDAPIALGRSNPPALGGHIAQGKDSSEHEESSDGDARLSTSPVGNSTS